MSSRWDPSAHPRDPVGRFSLIGGRGSQRSLANTDRWVDPVLLSGEDFSDLDVITNEGWGDLPRPATFDVLRGQVGRAQNMDELGAVAKDIFDQLEPDQQIELLGDINERGLAIRRNEQGRLSVPPVDLPRPANWDEDTWRGMPGSEVEKDLHGFYGDPPSTYFNPGTVKDLSEGGAMNDGVKRAELITADGVKVRTEIVVKRASSVEEADAEILGSELGHVMGVPSPVVINNPKDNHEVAMEAVIGHPGYAFGDHDPADMMYGDRKMIARYRESAARMAMMDQIMGNRDRHDGNWIMADSGEAVGIDNGLAFGGGRERYRSVEEIRRFQTEFMGNINQKASDWNKWGDRVSTEEMKSWAAGIKAMRPEFEKRGRLDWYEGALTNYTYLLRERIQLDQELA